jgi:hypothetical protein
VPNPCYSTSFAPGRLDITPWADRVQLISAEYVGGWELRGIGWLLLPPQFDEARRICRLGEEPTQLGRANALITWFGPPTAASWVGFPATAQNVAACARAQQAPFCREATVAHRILAPLGERPRQRTPPGTVRLRPTILARNWLARAVLGCAKNSTGEPSSMIRPRSMKMTRSATSSANPIS